MAETYDPYIAAAAALLALPIDPTWTATIARNLGVLRTAAAFVGDFPLPDEAEPAPVYEA